MRKNARSLDLVIAGMLKLDHHSGERQNVLAFIQSCYCSRVRDYDLNWAIAALTKLTDEEQNALITWMVINDEIAEQKKARISA